MPTEINVRCLNVSYGENTVLEQASLYIPAGQVTALIGPSGCGKSTFLKCINRLTDEEGARVSGSIKVDGKEILKNKINLPELRKSIGMVFQTPSVFPMSIFDNVAYGIRLHERLKRRELEERVAYALKRAGLYDEVSQRLRSDAGRLSGGQKQRLCIARTLAARPKALLLDEPTSALDPASSAEIEKLILSLRGELTVVIVTHSPPQARRIADRVAFFSGKRVAVVGDGSLLSEGSPYREIRKYLAGC